MPLIPRLRCYSIALPLCLPLLFGCDKIADHVEAGKMEMQFEHYNAMTNKLDALPTPAVARREAEMLTVGDKLVLIGGGHADLTRADEVEIYDPATKTFTAGATSAAKNNLVRYTARPSGLCFASLPGVDDMQHGCYNIKTNTWAAPPELPNNALPYLAALDDVMYAIGGPNAAGSGSQAFKLDDATNTWVAIADTPVVCKPNHIVAVDTVLYAFACKSGDPAALIIRYDPAADTWTPLPLTKEEADKLDDFAGGPSTAHVIGTKVAFYFYSGPPRPSVAVFDPAGYDMATMQGGISYSPAIAQRPPFRTAVGATSKALFIAGGYGDPEGACGNVESYDPATNMWTLHVARPNDSRICGGSLAVVGDEVFVLSSMQDASISIN